jgi:hypothetical protein
LARIAVLSAIPMKTQTKLASILALSALFAPGLRAADSAPGVSQPVESRLVPAVPTYRSLSEDRSYKAWKVSLAPMIAGFAVDATSSRGLRETNPVLAGSDGQFGAKGAMIKVGIGVALIGVEYLIVRKHPSAGKFLWKLNLGAAAVSGITAAHNYSQH